MHVGMDACMFVSMHVSYVYCCVYALHAVEMHLLIWRRIMLNWIRAKNKSNNKAHETSIDHLPPHTNQMMTKDIPTKQPERVQEGKQSEGRMQAPYMETKQNKSRNHRPDNFDRRLGRVEWCGVVWAVCGGVGVCVCLTKLEKP